jgi:DNA-binding LytR/AlgR family response regulator
MPINDIMYFVSEGRRTHLVANQFRDTFYQKLDEIEIIIEPKKANFIRIHKSYLVNILFIAKYNKDFVILKNGERLRISRYDYYKLLNKNIEGSDYTAVHVKGVLSNKR